MRSWRTRSARAMPSTCAASSSASKRGEPTPAAASRDVARSIAARTSCVNAGSAITGDRGGLVGLHTSLDHRVEVTVEHLVEVVGLEVHPVIGDAVLRVVVGPDALG